MNSIIVLIKKHWIYSASVVVLSIFTSSVYYIAGRVSAFDAALSCLLLLTTMLYSIHISMRITRDDTAARRILWGALSSTVFGMGFIIASRIGIDGLEGLSVFANLETRHIWAVLGFTAVGMFSGFMVKHLP
jgi:hypothetical protein